MSDEDVRKLAEKMGLAIDCAADNAHALVTSTLEPYARALLAARSALESASYALKHANSLRNGSWNEALAPKRNKPDATGVTAAQYAKANDETEATNRTARDCVVAGLAVVREALS